MNLSNYLATFFLSITLVACGGGGGNPGTAPGTASPPSGTASSPTTTANAAVAKITIDAGPGVLKADGTSSITFTIYALTSGNASVSGATINLAATNGVILSNASVETKAEGVTVTMIAPSSDQTNRVSVVTASCVTCAASAATTQVDVVGASIDLASSGSSSLVVGGAGSILSATVRDARAVSMSGVTVSFATTDSAILGLSAPTAQTNSLGVATVTVSGLAAGTASINVTAFGNAKSKAYTTGVASAVLAVTSPANNAVMVTAVPQSINVSAPGATSVTFTTTRGTFSNLTASQIVTVIGGNATASLTVPQAGTATITINDNLGRSLNHTLVVSPPPNKANKLLLNASQTTLPIATDLGGQSSLELTARAVYFDGTTDQSVANVPIEFSMSGGPGAGEFLSPALAKTDSAGYAKATFIAGAAASIPNGIVISARTQGTDVPVQTGTSPSGNNVALTVGGQALSVAFGPASVLGESADKTLYIQAYSVQVADANNNPVANQLVTLHMRPVAFSVGPACTIIQTYCSEDVNGNGSLDAGEDGLRTPTTVNTAGTCSSATPVATGVMDGVLTPQNSDGGSIPSIVVTDQKGVATFDLTYLKGSAIWVINKLTATISSNGTETSKSTIFRLAPSAPDVGPPCKLPASPYSD